MSYYTCYIVIKAWRAALSQAFMDFQQQDIMSAPLQWGSRLSPLKLGPSAVGHLVDDVLPVLRLPAKVRLRAPSTVLPLGQILKQSELRTGR